MSLSLPKIFPVMPEEITVWVSAFLNLVSGECEADDTITSVECSVESHYIALAAEKSRVNGGKVVALAEMREQQ